MKTFRKKLLGKASAKAQSAMEYLMTYGWAILIISIVLAALFQLGVFNPMAFAPKAQPGSCQVFRPNGPGTTSFINLEGVCSGELPQYVAQFNGQNGYISILYNWPPGHSITTVAWIYLNYIPNNNAGVFSAFAQPGNYNATIATFPNSRCNIQVWLTNTTPTAFAADSSLCVSASNWYQLVSWINQSSNTYGLYIDGKLSSSFAFKGTLQASHEFYIGLFPVQGAYFSGYISNVQVYNTALSANDIQALYQEGIGGAPINLQHLVAWWPLNGNADDYSGNDNNGHINNVNFVSNWYSSYTPP
jgi:hypothetical protein